MKHNIRVQEAFAIPSRGVRAVGDVGGPRGVSAPVNMISAMGENRKKNLLFLSLFNRASKLQNGLVTGEERRSNNAQTV